MVPGFVDCLEVLFSRWYWLFSVSLNVNLLVTRWFIHRRTLERHQVLRNVGKLGLGTLASFAWFVGFVSRIFLFHFVSSGYCLRLPILSFGLEVYLGKVYAFSNGLTRFN